jgi:hypothetical protein
MSKATTLAVMVLSHDGAVVGVGAGVGTGNGVGVGVGVGSGGRSDWQLASGGHSICIPETASGDAVELDVEFVAVLVADCWLG